MNKPATILSREEVEAMLPDYAFGMVSPEEALSFERSITAYPELQSELLEIQAALGPVRKEQYRDFTAQATKNLSVKVLRRMQERAQLRRSFAWRYLAPGLSLAAALVITIMPGGIMQKFAAPDPLMSSTAPAGKYFSQIGNAPDAEKEPVYTSGHLAQSVADEEEFAELLNLVLEEELARSVHPARRDELTPVIPGVEQINLLEQLNEDDVEQVLQELNNVDFS